MSELPTEEELSRLTLRAIVAYAARCARRVQPLFTTDNAEHIEDVDRAIRVAEAFARGVTAPLTASAGHNARNVADVYAVREGRPAREFREADPAYAAGDAAYAAAAAANGTRDAAANAARDAARSTAYSVDDARTIDVCIRRDYDFLAIHYPRTEGIHGEPIDPSENGPLGTLWPEGEPKWFKREETKAEPLLDDQSPLLVYIDPGDASKETIQEVLESLSDLHRTAGGLGLEFKVDGHLVLATEVAE